MWHANVNSPTKRRRWLAFETRLVYTLPMARPALLDPAFVRELEALRRRLEIRARGGNGGDHLAKRRGSSVEFREHRAYEPGDDLRRIDWSAYARTGEPMLKLFRAEEDVIARILCDTSSSMGSPDGLKLDFAKRFAAAVGYMVLARSERVQVFSAADGLVTSPPPNRGRAGLPTFLSLLDALTAEGATNLAKAVDATVRRSQKPGLLVVVSDFFDGADILSSLKQAAFSGHQLALVQVLSREEVDPTLEGDLALVDAESGATIEVTMDESALVAYQSRLQALTSDLEQFAKRHAASYLRFIASDDLAESVRAFVETGARR